MYTLRVVNPETGTVINQNLGNSYHKICKYVHANGNPASEIVLSSAFEGQVRAMCDAGKNKGEWKEVAHEIDSFIIAGNDETRYSINSGLAAYIVTESGSTIECVSGYVGI